MKSSENYENLSKMELIQRIVELEEVTIHMNNVINKTELLSLPWTGNLGHWHWMIQSDQLIFNEMKIINLGYKQEEIPEEVGFDFFTSKLHPDDYEQVMDNMRRHLQNKSDAYEVEYRIQTKYGDYAWYYDRGKVTKRNENGDPIAITGIVFDISENKAMEHSLREANVRLNQLVIKDELTTAYNKRFMIEKINDEIKRHDKSRLTFSLIMLDIDNFKSVNDNFGHNVGDQLLKEAVTVMMKNLRKTDVVARWGGDEFIILLPDTKISDAAISAENIRVAFGAISIEGLENVTISLGVSSYHAEDTIDQAVEKTDNLMYQAKSEGRNCVRY